MLSGVAVAGGVRVRGCLRGLRPTAAFRGAEGGGIPVEKRIATIGRVSASESSDMGSGGKYDSRRFAAVDNGTNSTRLLVAERREGRWEDVERINTITKFGKGVAETKVLSEGGIARTLQTLQIYK